MKTFIAAVALMCIGTVAHAQYGTYPLDNQGHWQDRERYGEQEGSSDYWQDQELERLEREFGAEVNDNNRWQERKDPCCDGCGCNIGQ